MDWYTAIEDRWTEFSLPSRLGTAIQLGMLNVTFPRGDLDPNFTAAALAAKLGYAARLVEVERYGHFPTWSDETLRELVPRADAGAIDYDAFETSFAALLDYTFEYASEYEAFSSLTGCVTPLWNGMTSIACWTFHKNVRKNRWGSTRVLALENFDYLMRIGYVLRCVDEALGESPRTTAEVESEAAP
jgi:hypothetical protein